MNKRFTLTFAAAAVTASPALGTVTAVERLILSPTPQTDITLAHGLTPDAPVLNGDPDENPDIVGPTTLNGFVAAGVEVSHLIGPSRAFVSETVPPGEAPPETDQVRNYWGAEGREIDGAQSLEGLDISVGVDNALTVRVFFPKPITGASGVGNDFVLTDFFGDDSVQVRPLSLTGAVIGSGAVIASGPGPNNIDTTDPGAWGWVGVDLTVAIESLPDTLFGAPAGPGTVFDNLKVAGVAFDVEDLFAPSESRAPVWGLEITGLELGSGRGNFDLGVAAVNAAALTPSPPDEGEP